MEGHVFSESSVRIRVREIVGTIKYAMVDIKLAAFSTPIVFLEMVILIGEKFGTTGVFAGMNTLIV